MVKYCNKNLYMYISTVRLSVCMSANSFRICGPIFTKLVPKCCKFFGECHYVVYFWVFPTHASTHAITHLLIYFHIYGSILSKLVSKFCKFFGDGDVVVFLSFTPPLTYPPTQSQIY